MSGSTVDEIPRVSGGPGGFGESATNGTTGRGLDEADRVPRLTGSLRVVAITGFCLVLAVTIVLRFTTKSALWLDEALTVDIARLPLSQIPEALKHDGAPPLFYYLLHFWMALFGQSDFATRSLSGIFGLASLVAAYFAGKTLGGRAVAWTTTVLVASAPFAVYYSTEARMYSLVILLTGCGFIALQRARARPRPGNLIAVAVVAAALLYSQYWSMYLVAAAGLWLLLEIIVRRVRTPATDGWKASIPALIALAVGGLTFVPWLPIFFYQSAHTGTPWAMPASFADILNMVTGFTFNQGKSSGAPTVWGRVLVLAYFGSAALALFGTGKTRWTAELDWRTRPRARGTTFVVVVTLLGAITGGLLTSSAFSPRYAAVVFLPFVVLVALGTTRFLAPTARITVIAITVLAGMFGSLENVTTQRTQATTVSTVINAHAAPGDIVAFCPDQIGPSVYRLTRDSSRFDMVTFPRGTGPAIVDWVDYAQVVKASHPLYFANDLASRAGTAHRIWVVWEGGYQTYGTKCERIVIALQQQPGASIHNWVVANPNKFYEPMNLSELTFAP